MCVALVVSDYCGLNVLPSQEESVKHEMQNLKRELKELTDRQDYAKVSVVTKRLTDLKEELRSLGCISHQVRRGGKCGRQ